MNGDGLPFQQTAGHKPVGPLDKSRPVDIGITHISPPPGRIGDRNSPLAPPAPATWRQVVPTGRVYRNETTDARHERAFFQYEALIVDKDFTFTAGKVMIQTILSKVFGREVKIRMRSGFFPFVEPGYEIDMECLVCGGKGCSVCKQVGWIEVMPGGTPHPNVLRSAGLDPDEYTGFYVNIGLDRLVMMRYGIDDVRLFNSADLRFLEQFR